MGDNAFPPKKILFIGNGAVEGGWHPLTRALGCEFIQDPDTAAALLAGYTFQYRRFRNELLIGLHEGRTAPETVLSQLKSELEILRQHRWQVANAYQTAHSLGAISLRMCEPIEELLKASDEVGVITTNWDPLLWKSEIPKLIQLHGLCEHFESLIFPSELGIDEQIYELARLTRVSEDVRKVVNELGKHYRGQMSFALQNAHGLAIQWLQEATSIVVWGLALHPYDAELLTVLQEWARGRTEWAPGCVTIINPSKTDRDRVGIVLGAPTWARREFDPAVNKWVVDCLENVMRTDVTRS